MTNNDNDAALLQRIAGGDQSALQTFYQRHQSRVYRFALSKVTEPQDAADVLNEVMLEVWRHAGRFEGRAKVTTWLLGIAFNKAHDKLRQRGRHQGEEVPENLADDKVDLEAAMSGLQDARRLRHCLEGLSPAHRQVIQLAFFDDLAYEEIASIMDCPPGTVKSRVFHAKNALKRCLAAGG